MALALASVQAAPGDRITAPVSDLNEAQDVVTLPVFYVSSKQENAYSATESSSGTRVATEIINLPFSVQVLTKEFIDDFQLNDTDLVIPFVGGGARGDPASGGGGGTRIRGFFTPVFRNGFARNQAPDTNSIERMEIVKGPQSAMYGRASPGGVINFISKKPKTAFQAGIRSSFGAYDADRVEGYVTGPLIKDKLFYRLDAAYYSEQNPTDFWYNRTLNLSGGLTYMFAKHTSLSVEFETTKRYMNDAADFNRYRDSAGAIAGSVFDLADRNVAERLVAANTAGAYRRANRFNDSFYITFEHQLADGLALRSNIGSSFRRFSRFGPSNAGLWDLRINNWQTDRSMGYTAIKYRQIGMQTDLQKTWRTEIPQRSLITFDVFDNQQKNKAWSLSGTPLTNQLIGLGFLTAADRATWFRPDPFHPEVSGYLPVPAFDPALWSVTEASTSNLYETYYGGLVNHTIELLKQRLILTASLREDWTDVKRQQPFSTVANLKEASQTGHQFSYTTGVNYHIIDRKLVAYISYGTSFSPSLQVDRNTGEILGYRTGRGGEIGVKGILLKGRLSYVGSAYRVTQDNETTANPENPTGSILTLPALIAGAGSKGQGASLEVSGSITRDLSLIGNISWVDIYIYKNAATPSLVGTAPLVTQNPPSRTASLAARYSPVSGALKGWKFGVTYQYESAYLRLDGTTNAAGVITAYDIWLKGRNEWSALLGYSYKTARKHRIGFTLNMKNIFDERVLGISGNAPRGRELQASVSLDL